MPSQITSQLRAKVAANIDFAITSKGMTNRAVAEAIGSTEHQVWRWRRGRVKPSDVTLAGLADALDRDLAWFYIDRTEDVAA